MSHDPRERFSAAADLYARHRPSYPAALFDWIEVNAGLRPGDPVLDLGCGTGISTRLLAERGWDVIGVDPNQAMLEAARRGGGSRYARGEATATGLPAASVALVSVAQAFHWFEIPSTLRELHRVLRPRGWVVAYWNVRALGSGFMRAYDDALRLFSREHAILDKPIETAKTLAAAPGVVELREAEFSVVQELEAEGLLGRAFSSSYVLHGVDDHEGFKARLSELHARFASEGRVAFSYRTIALAFRLTFP